MKSKATIIPSDPQIPDEETGSGIMPAINPNTINPDLSKAFTEAEDKISLLQEADKFEPDRLIEDMKRMIEYIMAVDAFND